MATYVEINNIKYPAVITGKLNDHDWNNRASKAITIEMAYEDALNTFVNNIQWNIVQDVEKRVEKHDENGDVMVNENKEVIFETVTAEEFYDNSEYCLAGDITDHRNGTVTVKMGKPTAEEQLVEMASIAANLEYQNLLAMNDMEVI